MDFLYPFFIAFFLVFISELGDKTQLLVLSFSSKIKAYIILIGVGLGSFFSHGIAILFGSVLGSLQNPFFHTLLEFITYISFIFFGIITFCDNDTSVNKNNNIILQKLSHSNMHYIFIIASSIAIGELGDKTFLASLGLGTQYPAFKLHLIIGAILGMIASNTIAIALGKFLTHKFSSKTITFLSGTIFILFGLIRNYSFFYWLLTKHGRYLKKNIAIPY